MERPVTSKPRGVCRYYNTSRGCFAGDTCKFLHGPDEKYTPYDKAKVCRYYVNGHCKRGDQCWFRHELPSTPPEQIDADTCSICMEKPTTYGLLNCSHVFCLQCIRRWRDKNGKSYDVVSTGTIKCCPLCRGPSRFVTPSSLFFPSGHSKKEEIINNYRASMARTPCKYFEEALRHRKLCCPFGNDCFYKHTKSDGSPHVFRYGAAKYMILYRKLQEWISRRRPPSPYLGPMLHLRSIFDNMHLIRTRFSNIQERLEYVEASLDRSNNETMSAAEEDDFEAFRPDLGDDELNILLSIMFDEAWAVEDSLATARAESMRDVPQAPDDQTEQRSSDRPASAPPVVLTSDTSSLAPSHEEASDEPTDSELNHTPTPDPPSSTRRAPTPRFSTVVNSRSRDALAIDASDEENTDAVPTSDSYQDNTADTRTTQDPTSPPLLSPFPNVDAQNTADNEFTSAATANSRDDDTHPDHNNEPPFVTDGRGRVVWSSPCTGWGGQAEGREMPSSRGNSTTKSTRP